jgi:hypothetical protein
MPALLLAENQVDRAQRLQGINSAIRHARRHSDLPVDAGDTPHPRSRINSMISSAVGSRPVCFLE